MAGLAVALAMDAFLCLNVPASGGVPLLVTLLATHKTFGAVVPTVSPCINISSIADSSVSRARQQNVLTA